MASQQLKVKSKMALVEVIGHLEDLVACLKQGRLYISKQEENIHLKPHDPVLLEIAAEAKLEKDSLRETLMIALKWNKGESANVRGESFVITHQELPPGF